MTQPKPLAQPNSSERLWPIPSPDGNISTVELWGVICWEETRSANSILSPDVEIVQPEAHDPRINPENRVAVLGISTQYRKFSDPFVALPFHASGHPVTGLNRDCAVILQWYAVIVIPDDVEFLAGEVPGRLMREINSAVRRDLLGRLGSQMGTVTHLLSLLRSRS